MLNEYSSELTLKNSIFIIIMSLMGHCGQNFLLDHKKDILI